MDRNELRRLIALAVVKWPRNLGAIRRLVDLDSLFPRELPDVFSAVVHTSSEVLEQLGAGPAFLPTVAENISIHQPHLAQIAHELLRQIIQADVYTESGVMFNIQSGSKALLADDMRIATPDQLDNLLARGQATQTALSPPSGGHVDIFSNGGEGFLIQPVSEPSGIYMFDSAMGGMPAPGTLTLAVMPSKAGKTLLAMQVSGENVQRGRYNLYFNFEQIAKGDLAVRAFLRMTDSTTDDWKGVTNVEQQRERRPDIYRRYRENLEQWQKYWYFCTTWAGMKDETTPPFLGMESIRATVLQAAERFGQMPYMVIIDWWRRLWRRAQEDNPRFRTSANDSHASRQREIDALVEFKYMADELGIRSLVFQQMATHLAKQATNINNLHEGMAAENKSLVQVADVVWVSTPKLEEVTVNQQGKLASRLSVGFYHAFHRGQAAGSWRRFAKLDGPRQLFLAPTDKDRFEGTPGALSEPRAVVEEPSTEEGAPDL